VKRIVGILVIVLALYGLILSSRRILAAHAGCSSH
jgi:hypothetical protein